MPFYRSHVLVCAGTACTSSGSLEVRHALRGLLEDRGLDQEIKLVETGCFGFCRLGPIMVVYPEGVFYCQVKAADVPEIVEEHLLKGRAVERLLYVEPGEDQPEAAWEEIDFFQHQQRIALRNCGYINPEVIEEYIALDGYFALYKVLHEMSPEQVIAEIKESGLRGRGGGGFRTGLKWEFAAKADNQEKYVVCNGDEGDPGAFMDRSILEGDPHSVMEAMAIAGYAIGAHQGFIYVRAEYPIAVTRLEIAIKQARQLGVLGSNIFDSNFDFDIQIRLGAGAFVCGEETALMASIQGRRGEPRPRPPFPAVSGLWGKPTLINNVETLANIPQIILQGGKWFAALGTEKSNGTKVFALAGKVNNTGLIEVPMGTTLRTIVETIGGGVPGDHHFKAAQTGGPSGGCLPEQYLDIPMEYETLMEIGSMMGSGGLIVMDDSDCMVDIARFFLEFSRDESCGKCTPCRIGTTRMFEILTRITRGQGEEGDLDKLEALAATLKTASLCGLGQTASNPVLSTMKYFRDEYVTHIRDKRCPAGVCKELLSYRVIGEECRACGICTKVCPVQAARGEPKKAPEIDPERCTKCGVCAEKCPFKAIRKG